ncbi:MAG: hypothetical protein HFI90_03350 [Clostridia bacterium]|nr:hypothetical protein [Clostridia bacterium]
MRTIQEVFHENIFGLFVEFCHREGYVYLQDLNSLDFRRLNHVKGIGKAKREKILYRWNLEKQASKSGGTAGASEVFDEIHPSNDKVPLLCMNDMGRFKKTVAALRQHGINTAGELARYRREEIYTNEPSIYESVLELQSLLSLPGEQLVQRMLDYIKENYHYSILVQRAAGVTLQQLGNQMDITRERVRQIEQRLIEYVNNVIEVVCHIYQAKYRFTDYISFRSFRIYFHAKEDLEVVKYVVSVARREECLNFADKLLVNGMKAEEVLRKLEKITAKHIGEVQNFYEKVMDIDEALTARGISFVDLEDYLNYLLMNGYKKSGDYVYRGISSYGKLCAVAVKKYFKNGIRIYDDEQIERLRELVHLEFEGLELAGNNRSVMARVSNYLVLCDRGTYISKDRIKINPALLEEIYQYILSLPSSTVLFSELYLKFQEKLDAQSNVHNKYFLQGVLKYYFQKEFKFERDLIIKKGMEKQEIRTQIAAYIKSCGRPVHKNEIKEKFMGTSEMVILNTSYRNSEILHWQYNYFIHADFLKVTEEDRAMLHDALQQLFDKFSGYANEYLLYDCVKQQTAFLEKNSIQNSTNLFYVADYLFAGEFQFKRPHIVRNREKFPNLNTDDIIRAFFFDKSVISYSDYLEFIKEVQLSMGTSYAVFKHIEQDLVRISEDAYIKKEQFHLCSEAVEQIYQVIRRHIGKDRYLPIIKIDFYEELPEIGLAWNAYLMETVLYTYPGEEYVLVAPHVEDRRYIKTIIVPKERNVRRFDELVAAILQELGSGGITLYQFENLLITKGIIGKYFPKELYQSKLFYQEDGKFYPAEVEQSK